MTEQRPDESSPGRSGAKAIILVLAAAAVAFALGYFLAGPGKAPQAPAHETHEVAATVWTCSMHPQIRLPKPGKCPICFMDLIPVEGGSGKEEAEASPRSITLTPQAIMLAEVRTAPVIRKDVIRETRMTGSVDYDERRLATITAWIPGRIDRLFVDYTGAQVKKGDPLALLYSPELVTAQAEILQAARADKEAQATGMSYVKDAAARTLASAREKLRLLGIGADQVDRILAGGEPLTHITVRSPIAGTVITRKAVSGMYVMTGETLFQVADLSRVWVVLAAYESDLPWVGMGTTVDFTAEAMPGKTFSGKVVYVDPMVDMMTRTIRVRLDADNRDGLLKPGMFVRAELSAPAPGETAEPPLVIPDTAPLLTGTRAVVYVERSPGTYEGREVELGPRAGSWYIVKSGLSEGEKVVVNGNFKIDSAMQILARPSMMSPEGGGPAPGMNMPGMKMEKEGGAETPMQGMDMPAEGKSMPSAASAPAAFRQSLGGVFKAYRPLSEALSSDDLEKAKLSGTAVSEALSGTDMTLLSGEAHISWMKDLSTMENGLSRIKEAQDIEAARKGFHDVSLGLSAALASLGAEGTGPVYEIFCPMAFDGKGATWLSHDQTVRNPYYGAAMYGCGEVRGQVAGK
ncbi:MAG: efflux RND transporter periplasmic adaptor subunit [Thermodesulfobacteriota bacterium]